MTELERTVTVTITVTEDGEAVFEFLEGETGDHVSYSINDLHMDFRADETNKYDIENVGEELIGWAYLMLEELEDNHNE